MKHVLNISRFKTVLLILSMCYSVCGYAQMKIGNHPSQIHKASILELESNSQGLLLTRISDTSTMTSLNPPDGMIIYSTHDKAIFIRSNHAWKKLITASVVPGNAWDLNGNAGTDSASNFLGTTDMTGLRIGTNNAPAIVISRTGLVQLVDSLSIGGNADFQHSAYISDSLSVGRSVRIGDSLRVEKTLYIGDSVTLKTVRQALPSDNEVLVISPEGIIRKQSLDSLKIAGGTSGVQSHLKLDTVALSQGHHGPWIDSLSAKSDSTLILNLPNADIAVRGLVSDSIQAFSGNKKFRDSIAVGGMGNPNSSLQVNGNLSTSTQVINSGSSYDMTNSNNAKYRTIILDVTSLSGEFTVNLPQAGSDVNGRIYTIRKVGKADDAQIDEDLKIIPTGSDSFEDGGTSYFIYNNFSSVTLKAKDGKWYFVR